MNIHAQRDDDTQAWLGKHEPLTNTFEANVINRSRVMATLCGRDADELKDRAHRYASAMNWHRAIVSVTRVGEASAATKM